MSTPILDGVWTSQAHALSLHQDRAHPMYTPLSMAVGQGVSAGLDRVRKGMDLLSGDLAT